MKKKQAVVVIPIYKKSPETQGKRAIQRCIEILCNYDFCYIAPKSLDTSEYEAISRAQNKECQVKRFEDEYFKDVKNYSRLCLKSKLYKAFSDYEYMFLFQEDGWVFKDELKHWCDMGFDYIGAPWFEGYSNAAKTSAMVEFSGNGGVSLRKISSFIKALQVEESVFEGLKTHPIKTLAQLIFKDKYKTEMQKMQEHTNEDVIITQYFRNSKGFKIAPNKKAMYFSFETLPERLYQLTEGVLPFACHAYKKYNPEFWKKFIDF